MKVLVDTNVILDVALKRAPFFDDSARFFKVSSQPEMHFYVTATTVTDLYYIIRKARRRDDARDFIRDLLGIFEVAGVDRLALIDALNSNISDFEDAVQCAAAAHENVRIVVTRNEVDFAQSKLKVFNPASFLDSLK